MSRPDRDKLLELGFTLVGTLPTEGDVWRASNCFVRLQTIKDEEMRGDMG
jgi:hypothetical protein